MTPTRSLDRCLPRDRWSPTSAYKVCLSPWMRAICFLVKFFSDVRNKAKGMSYRPPAARLIGERTHAMICFRSATAPSRGRMPMPFRTSAAAFIFVISSIGAAAQPNTVDAVKLGGGGVLTKRIDWLVASSRRIYHHIRLPERIAVGHDHLLFRQQHEDLRLHSRQDNAQRQPLRNLQPDENSSSQRQDQRYPVLRGRQRAAHG
jgi:hypothetical protein